MPIYDLSYKRIEGIRVARGLRFLTIASTGIRHYFKKRVNVFLFLPAVVLTILGGFLLVLPSLLADPQMIKKLPPAMQSFLHLTPDSAFRIISQWNYWFVALIAAMAGAGAIANDITSNALEIYFSRPLTRFDYVFGKFLTIVSLCALSSMVPLAILWLLDISVSDEPGYLKGQVPLLFEALAAQFVVIVTLALVILAVSSLARTQRNAMLTFAVILIGNVIVSGALTLITRNRDFQLLNVNSVLNQIGYELLGVGEGVVQSTRGGGRLAMITGNFKGAVEPLRDVAFAKVIAVACGWWALALFVLRRRVRGFEVVKG